MDFTWVYTLPLWTSGLAILAIFLLAIEAGLRTGLRVRRAGGVPGQAPAGDLTLTALLALLGLLLAFTYAFSLSRYDHRKDASIAEINAIGTAFLRADLLPEPGRTELRRRLLDYARTRRVTAKMFRTKEEAARTVRRSLEVQAALWPTTRAAITKDVPAPVAVSVVTAINTVLDVHTQRVVAGFDRIPAVVLILLVAVSALSLAMAAHSAALQNSPSRWRLSAFALVLVALILVIMDFDMALSGLIQNRAWDMTNLIEEMEAALRPH